MTAVCEKVKINYITFYKTSGFIVGFFMKKFGALKLLK